MSEKIALITVVYQNYSLLKDLFVSLKKQNNKNYHLYIADLSKNKKKVDSDGIPLTIIPGENKGYSHGVNLCLDQAKKEGINLFCVINDDIILSGDFIEKLSDSFTDHPNSIIGGKIFYASGFEYYKDRYQEKDRGKVIWYAGGQIDWNNVHIKHDLVDIVDKGNGGSAHLTDFVTGCLFAFDLYVLDNVGLWDESYFLYYEDADYCERAKRKGVSLYYDPTLVIWHKNAQSTSGSGSKLHVKYQEKNRIRFGLKYAPLKTKLHLFLEYIKKSLSF